MSSQLISAYPNRPIVLVVPFPLGHPSDFAARRLAPRLAELLRQSVTVENWPGASGTTGAARMKHQPPDGYGLMIHGVNGFAIAPHVMEVGYDPIRDFAPVIKLHSAPLVLVVNPVLVNTVQELITHVKNNPGTVNGASFGTATNAHLALVLFNQITGLNIPHAEYVGGTRIAADLIAGRFQLMFDFPNVVVQHIKAGQLRALAVTSSRRIAALPNVPTFAEEGVQGMEITGWQGMFAPAGTAPDIIANLNATLARIQAMPEVRTEAEDVGFTAESGTPEEFATFIRSEYDRWGKVIEQGKIHLD
jgi:tripartite-type tricarboxylate transporter receptor subunit TctC